MHGGIHDRAMAGAARNGNGMVCINWDIINMATSYISLYRRTSARRDVLGRPKITTIISATCPLA